MIYYYYYVTNSYLKNRYEEEKRKTTPTLALRDYIGNYSQIQSVENELLARQYARQMFQDAQRGNYSFWRYLGGLL